MFTSICFSFFSKRTLGDSPADEFLDSRLVDDDGGSLLLTTSYWLCKLFSVMLGICVNVMISSDDSNIKWTMNRTIIHCRSASRASEHHTNHALLVWTFFNNMPPSFAINEFWHIEVFGLVWSGACLPIFSVYNMHVSVWETYCVLCLTGLSTWKMKAKATNHAFSSFITKYYTHTYKRHCWQKERS